MKLSHLEFKPDKRTKFVGPPPVKKPKLRIFLFLLLAIPLYFLFENPSLGKFLHQVANGDFFKKKSMVPKQEAKVIALTKVKVTDTLPRLKEKPNWNPQPPLQTFRIAAAGNAKNASYIPKALWLSPLHNLSLRPILPGKVVEIHRDSGNTWIKLYHGLNVYSYYWHFDIDASLKEGDMVKNNLGRMHSEDSTSSMGLQIEKDGLFISPITFLNLKQE